MNLWPFFSTLAFRSDGLLSQRALPSGWLPKRDRKKKKKKKKKKKVI